MSTFTEKETGKIVLGPEDRVLNINRLQIKEIYRWSSSLKEKNPQARAEGQHIIELFQRSISPMNPKPVMIIIKVEEINKLLWWYELSQVLDTDLTQPVILLLKNCRDKVKPTPEKPETPK